MKLQAEEFVPLAQTVKELCGVFLDQSRSYLIEHRLGPVAEQFDCRDFTELSARLVRPEEKDLRSVAIDAITTHETLFFRDRTPFDAFAFRVVPDLIDGKAGTPHARRLRIWSAASSTGQEAYSLAMALLEIIPNPSEWDIQIVATDISDMAVQRGIEGLYNDFEMNRGLSDSRRAQFFEEVQAGWRVLESVRQLVKFHTMNLMEPAGWLPKFDIVFCRHVAIYFDADARAALYRKLAGSLAKPGYLFLSNSESLDGYGLDMVQQAHCGAIYYQTK